MTRTLGFSLILGVSVLAACEKDAGWNQPNGPLTTPFSPPPTAVGPKPDFGATKTLDVSPPPVSGGTLLVTADGTRAVAADPDRDNLYIVDLKTRSATTIALQAFDEPGRLVEDHDHRVHVALRRGGALLSVDLAAQKIIARRQVCSAPRGVTYDAPTDSVTVACRGGEIVTLPAGGGAATRTLTVAYGGAPVTDLRDVIALGGELFVTRFRDAELLEIDRSGHLVNRTTPSPSNFGMQPAVGWRLIAVPGPVSTLAMVHQRGQESPVSTQPGGYGQSSVPDCQSSIVEATVSVFAGPGGTQPIAGPTIPEAVLPVDLAMSPDGRDFAIVAAGNGKTGQLPGVLVVDAAAIGGGGDCTSVTSQASLPGIGGLGVGQATAVAFTSASTLVVQTREPAALHFLTFDPSGGNSFARIDATVALAPDSREDTGHSIFHSNAGGFVACASCHAEGADDGRVWTFADAQGNSTTSGGRRTQSLHGTLAGTAPYHWEGDMKDMPMLSHEVFVNRMEGDELAADRVAALQSWLFALPAPAASPATDPSAVSRGAAIFASAAAGCTTCHSGAMFTNNATLDVGTGGAFQVPSLIGVGSRAPYLHDGRAATLTDRFDANIGGGDQHGHTSQLSNGDVSDLIAFLNSL